MRKFLWKPDVSGWELLTIWALDAYLFVCIWRLW
jgi:hypothetical protein